MNKLILCGNDMETTSETVNQLINTNMVNGISDFVGNDMGVTTITTIIGIVAGVAFSIKNRFWRNFTIILCAIIFNVFMLLRMIFISEPLHYLIISVVAWFLLCFGSIVFMREKGIVSRKKIGKMIETFTSTANPSKDVCIFAGDIDFFGEVLETPQSCIDKSIVKKHGLFALIDAIKQKRKEHLLNKTNIENNSQFKQLKDPKFRSICILCIKPPLPKGEIKDDYYNDRIRIGYIKETFGERVHFKFFNDDCDNCFFYEQNNCLLQNCTHQCTVALQSTCACPKSNNNFSHPSLPDTTLRGRIVTNRETDAKCVAITTKRSSRKDYILRQYGSGEKESSLYNVIWKVWWKMCEEDNDFINMCLEEYHKSKSNDAGDN